MKITFGSILAALGILLCLIGIHRFTPWSGVGSRSYWYRTCERCSEIETTQLIKGSMRGSK